MHGFFGGAVHLARGSGLDGLFGGRAEVVRGLAHLPYAGGIAGFHRCVGEKPISKKKVPETLRGFVSEKMKENEHFCPPQISEPQLPGSFSGCLRRGTRRTPPKFLATTRQLHAGV